MHTARLLIVSYSAQEVCLGGGIQGVSTQGVSQHIMGKWCLPLGPWRCKPPRQTTPWQVLPQQAHPRAGTPPRQVHPIPSRYTIPGRYSPPPGNSACWDTVNKRAVRIQCFLLLDVNFWSVLTPLVRWRRAMFDQLFPIASFLFPVTVPVPFPCSVNKP